LKKKNKESIKNNNNEWKFTDINIYNLQYLSVNKANGNAKGPAISEIMMCKSTLFDLK
jgi:hypothetical protein